MRGHTECSRECESCPWSGGVTGCGAVVYDEVALGLKIGAGLPGGGHLGYAR